MQQVSGIAGKLLAGYVTRTRPPIEIPLINTCFSWVKSGFVRLRTVSTVSKGMTNRWNGFPAGDASTPS